MRRAGGWGVSITKKEERRMGEGKNTLICKHNKQNNKTKTKGAEEEKNALALL